MTQEEEFDQAIRNITTSAKTDSLSEETTRMTTIIDTVITKQHQHTSQTKSNPGVWEVAIIIHNRLQHHDKTHPSRISADNSDQIHLILQWLTTFEIETRAKIYPTTRSSQPPTMEISQT